MKIALLISTYNWPQALGLILKAVKNQTRLPDVILIADDGSGAETQSLIKAFQAEISVPIQHVWQEDKGFRKAKILNKAVAATDADYILQIDGDCVPERHFVEDHIKNSEENCFLYGARASILRDFVAERINTGKTEFTLFSKGLKKKGRILHIPFFAGFYKKHLSFSEKFRGCNFSFWRKDFLSVNGYNEDFEGWGLEDSDLAIRMTNNQVFSRRLRYCGIVFHLDHPVSAQDRVSENNAIQCQTIKNKIKWCKNGVSQYL
ncbi:MAG: glycosyltransferase family 2 protein [Dysgonamonadaceae bacterium]